MQYAQNKWQIVGSETEKQLSSTHCSKSTPVSDADFRDVSNRPILQRNIKTVRFDLPDPHAGNNNVLAPEMNTVSLAYTNDNSTTPSEVTNTDEPGIYLEHSNRGSSHNDITHSKTQNPMGQNSTVIPQITVPRIVDAASLHNFEPNHEINLVDAIRTPDMVANTKFIGEQIILKQSIKEMDCLVAAKKITPLRVDSVKCGPKLQTQWYAKQGNKFKAFGSMCKYLFCFLLFYFYFYRPPLQNTYVSGLPVEIPLFMSPLLFLLKERIVETFQRTRVRLSIVRDYNNVLPVYDNNNGQTKLIDTGEITTDAHKIKDRGTVITDKHCTIDKKARNLILCSEHSRVDTVNVATAPPLHCNDAMHLRNASISNETSHHGNGKQQHDNNDRIDVNDVANDEWGKHPRSYQC